ncbi:GNAT family N-acetyltransferase [Paracoccus litorisediminis]|jgi:putative hemolysin
MDQVPRPTMTPDSTYLETRLATDQADLLSAQRLRYRVFVEELGGDGALVDHQNRLERDEFDEVVDHLVLVDTRRPTADLDHVVGAYRLLPGERASGFGRFYCDAEYDLDPLRRSDRSLLELGRSCVDPAFRGGAGMFLLWNALADYVLEREIQLLFGVASFHGTDVNALAQPLSWLHHHHLAAPALRPVARAPGHHRMDLIAPDALDRRAAMTGMPPLIKAYLRLGGTIGEGAFVDHDFNTTDVFLLVDTAAMSAKHKKFYEARWQAQ